MATLPDHRHHLSRLAACVHLSQQATWLDINACIKGVSVRAHTCCSRHQHRRRMGDVGEVGVGRAVPAKASKAPPHCQAEPDHCSYLAAPLMMIARQWRAMASAHHSTSVQPFTPCAPGSLLHECLFVLSMRTRLCMCCPPLAACPSQTNLSSQLHPSSLACVACTRSATWPHPSGRKHVPCLQVRTQGVVLAGQVMCEGGHTVACACICWHISFLVHILPRLANSVLWAGLGARPGCHPVSCPGLVTVRLGWCLAWWVCWVHPSGSPSSSKPRCLRC